MIDDHLECCICLRWSLHTLSGAEVCVQHLVLVSIALTTLHQQLSVNFNIQVSGKTSAFERSTLVDIILHSVLWVMNLINIMFKLISTYYLLFRDCPGCATSAMSSSSENFTVAPPDNKMSLINNNRAIKILFCNLTRELISCPSIPFHQQYLKTPI